MLKRRAVWINIDHYPNGTFKVRPPKGLRGWLFRKLFIVLVDKMRGADGGRD